MTALTADRNTLARAGNVLSYPVAAGVTIYAGAALVLDGGYAKPATAAAGLVGIGRAEEQVDNSAGADGAVNVRVWPGVYRWVNSSGRRRHHAGRCRPTGIRGRFHPRHPGPEP